MVVSFLKNQEAIIWNWAVKLKTSQVNEKRFTSNDFAPKFEDLMNSIISSEKKPPLPFLLTPPPPPLVLMLKCWKPPTLLHLQLLNVKKTTMMMLMEVPKVIPPSLNRGCDTVFLTAKDVVLPDLWSCRTFGLAGPLVLPDLWFCSCRTSGLDYSIVKDSNAKLTVGNWNFKILP